MAKRKRPGKAQPTKTRTQLNNARKRAAKKRAKQQAKLVDPSLVYIQNPLGAPTVVRAKGWFADLGKKLSLRLGPLEGWRTSAKLAVRASGASGAKIGLFVPKSHDVVPINGCAAHHASINTALEAISTACKAARIRGYDEDKGEGDLRYVKLEVQRSSELVQVTLVWHASSQEEAGKPLRKLVTALQQHELWYSIWANFHAADKHTSRILALEKEAWVQLAGRKRWLREPLQRSAVPYHCELCFPPFVFRQANLCAFERIVSAVRRFVPFGRAVVELYAGVGTIGLHLADVAGSLVCSDENPFNRACFRRSLKSLPPDLQQKLGYVSGDAASQVDSIPAADVVIVDPPRKGMEDTVLDALTRPPKRKSVKPYRLIYVSCGFPAFCRDAEKLMQHGWTVLHAEGFVLFPGSDHLETFCVFERT